VLVGGIAKDRHEVAESRERSTEMMIFVGLFWIAILAVGGWLIYRWASGSKGGRFTIGKQDPLTIARERYAKGEITREQFEQLRNDLA
jgi:putative membrane protein